MVPVAVVRGQFVAIAVAAGALVGLVVVQVQEVEVLVLPEDPAVALFQKGHRLVQHPRVVVHVPHHLLQPAQRGVLVHQVKGDVRDAAKPDVQDVAEKRLHLGEIAPGRLRVVCDLGEAELLQVGRLEDHRVKGPRAGRVGAGVPLGVQAPAGAAHDLADGPFALDDGVVGEVLIEVYLRP